MMIQDSNKQDNAKKSKTESSSKCKGKRKDFLLIFPDLIF